MHNKEAKQIKQTNHWFAQNGINVAHIYVGTTELFQATKLATNVLKNFGSLLGQDQAEALNKFLKATRNVKERNKITQGQCFKVMNITKQAQRKFSKLSKFRK
jgi:arsenate reductase-like glutaredoxin family protein